MSGNLLKLDLENQLQPTMRPAPKSNNVVVNAAAEYSARIKFFGLDKMFYPVRVK